MGKPSAVGQPTIKANSAFHRHGVDKYVVSFISWCYNCSFSRGAPLRTTGKCRCGVIGRCDPHLSALEVRFSQRCAIQIDVYLLPTGLQPDCLHGLCTAQRFVLVFLFFSVRVCRTTLGFQPVFDHTLIESNHSSYHSKFASI